MATLLISLGWVLNGLATLWLLVIVLDLIWDWVRPQEGGSGLVRTGLSWLAVIPANGLRCLIPTVFRGVDFAPWLAIIGLMLTKTFILRALIYWGMLHRPV